MALELSARIRVGYPSKKFYVAHDFTVESNFITCVTIGTISRVKVPLIKRSSYIYESSVQTFNRVSLAQTLSSTAVY